MQMQLNTSSASMAFVSTLVQQAPTTPSSNILFPTTQPPPIFPTSSYIPIAQNPFWVESKVDIKVFDGRMDVESLDTWIQAIEVFFSC
eukprot:Gb_25792 [translate_table: standard]